MALADPMKIPSRGDDKAEFHAIANLFSDLTMESEQALPELFTVPFAKAVVCEFVATVIFIFVALGAAFNWPSEQPSVLHIAMTFGLSIATLIQAFGHISGTHVNPAVTIAFFVGNQISIFRLLFYVALQLMGAVVGAGMIYSVTPSKVHITLALNDLSKDVSPGEALVIEIILTFAVVMCIFSSIDKRRTDNRGNPAFSIGMAVTMAHLVGIYYTGCSINPARSFAPAVILGRFGDSHWVFWLGPITGASLASIIYNYVLYPHELTKDQRIAIIKGLLNPESEESASSEATDGSKPSGTGIGTLNEERNERTSRHRKGNQLSGHATSELTHPIAQRRTYETQMQLRDVIPDQADHKPRS